MKTIYDEALDILVDSFTDPQDEEDDSYMLNRRQMNKISKAIRTAQKQEKLLKLYKELSNYVDEQTYAHKLPEITTLKIKINELENDERRMRNERKNKRIKKTI